VAQLFSLGHMTRSQDIGDFVLGAATMAFTPIVVFFVAGFGLSFARSSRFFPLLILAFSFFSFVAVCVWRWKHRRLPRLFFAAEFAVAICANAAFVLVFGPPDTGIAALIEL